jgi:hypothetical protein
MKTIEEKNKMIAEFMGYRWLDDDNMWIKGEWPSCSYLDKYLEYDTSWDWLMPVVKKCRDLVINPKNGDEVYILSDLDNKVMSCNNVIAFDGLVGFIEWYNNKK